jgi:DNA-binding beta-propeller fold protein YncE
VSRDGKHLYVASQDNNAVAIFARNAVTGALTQLSGAAGCIAQNGDGVTCALGRGLLNPIHLEVSSDGQYVYGVSRDSNAVTIFARNVTTGVLTQLPGLAGCIAENGDGRTCAVGAGLREAVFLTLSPDGTNVYVASQVSDAVAIFTRNALTGALTQLPGVAGCVSEDGSDDGMARVCADGKGLEGAIAVTVSPDGLNVYAAAYISKALTIFIRQ